MYYNESDMDKAKFVLYKDNPEVNHRSKLREQIEELAKIVRLAEQSPDTKKKLRQELLNGVKSKGVHMPNHIGCTGCCDSGRVTEKRLCRCMYYFNTEKDKTCATCKIKTKWKNVGRIAVTEYEYPTKYVLDNVGGIDLLFDDVYAVEVKPQNSDETLARMLVLFFILYSFCQLCGGHICLNVDLKTAQLRWNKQAVQIVIQFTQPPFRAQKCSRGQSRESPYKSC